MDILSNGFTSISISLGNDILNKIVSSNLKLRLILSFILLLTLVLIHYSIKNNLIINTIVVNGTLVWNTITRMVLNLYPLHRGCVWEVSGV